MALNTSKCNHLPPLPYKGLRQFQIVAVCCGTAVRIELLFSLFQQKCIKLVFSVLQIDLNYYGWYMEIKGQILNL